VAYPSFKDSAGKSNIYRCRSVKDCKIYVIGPIDNLYRNRCRGLAEVTVFTPRMGEYRTNMDVLPVLATVHRETLRQGRSLKIVSVSSRLRDAEVQN
jgi:hypothetical protein